MPDDSDRFPLDTLLRKHGWRIEARPAEGEALWRKGEVILGQADALERLPWRQVDQARKGAA